jgi:hypothetical integral membrane protein (TIGR02206 family)
MGIAVSTFTPYGLLHLATLAVIAAAAWGMTRVGRRSERAARQRTADRVLGISALTQWVIVQAAELRPSQFDLTHSLPLHVCDLVGLAGALAILTRLRLFRAMLYYWGVGLSIGALFLPELTVGITHEKYWLFWVPHGFIIILAAYDLFARGYRPGWRDYGLALGALTLFIAMIFPFDVAFTLNYGFVGPNAPGAGHLLDFLGEWPFRVIKLALAVILFLAAITLPWGFGGSGTGSGKGGVDETVRPPSPPRRRPMIDGLEERISI